MYAASNHRSTRSPICRRTRWRTSPGRCPGTRSRLTCVVTSRGGADDDLDADGLGAGASVLSSPPLHEVLAATRTRSVVTSPATRRLGVLMVGQSLMSCGSGNTLSQRPPFAEHLLARGSSLDD